MTEEIKPCDLCGLVVELDGFNLLTKQGKKDFCCAGCQCVYQLLNEENLIEEKQQNS